MRTEPWLLSLAAVGLGALSASPSRQEAGSPAPEAAGERSPGGLVRVEPVPGEEEPATAGEPFDAAAWRLALSAEDLDLREHDFGRLVRRARADREAWSFLRELSEDAGAPELAWTARLALREVEARGVRRFPRALVGPGVRLAEPFGDLGALLEELGADLALPGALPPHGARRSRQEDRSVSIQNDGTTWRVRVRERVGGEEAVRAYEGESLEAILEENPELAEDLGVLHLGGDPQGFRVELGLPLESSLEEVFGDLRGFRRLSPSGTFEMRGAAPGRWQIFVAPQAPSRPLTTDVLGVRVAPLAEGVGARLGLPEGVGLWVQTSYPGTIAHLVGVGAGDVLLSLDGQPMASADDVTRRMQERSPGEPVTLEWIDGQGERRRRTWTPPPAPAAPPSPDGGGGPAPVDPTPR